MVSNPPLHKSMQGAELERLFAEVYKEEFDFVWRLIRRFGGRERDREDLAHDVFVAVHRSLASYERQRAIRPWLFGITFRVVSDYRRRARFERELPVAEHLGASSAPVAIERIEQGEREALVAAGLQRLPLDQRVVFVMHEMEGLSVPDIARELGIPDNTCYSRLRLGRERFVRSVRVLAAQPQRKALEETG